MPELSSRRLPLDGVRVIELGQLLAGPFTLSLIHISEPTRPY